MPSTLSILITVFPAEERGRAVGAWAGTAGGAGILALIASGALLEAFSWQSIFVPNAALGAPLLVAIARDRESTRLNSSHAIISSAVFCLKKIICSDFTFG